METDTKSELASTTGKQTTANTSVLEEKQDSNAGKAKLALRSASTVSADSVESPRSPRGRDSNRDDGFLTTCCYCICKPCCALVNTYAGDTQAQIQIIFALYFVIGTICAVIFYVRWNEWSVAESFYYTIQTATSVGFGVLEEKSDMSRFGSLVIVLSGSMGLATVLGLLVAKVLARYDDLKEEMEDEFTNSLDTDMDGKVGLAEFKRFIERTDETLWKEVGEEGIEELFREIDTEENGTLSLTEYQSYKLRAQSFAFGWFSAVVAWVQKFRLFIIFTTYILVGALWGCAYEGWSFITSVYYAFTACATGGLQQPSRDDIALLFTAFFILFGIPLYATTLGTVASYFGEYVIHSVMQEEMENREAQRTANFMKRLDVLSDGRISFEEWLYLELLRKDKCDMNFLKQCKNDFRIFDDDRSGTLSIDELRVQMPVIDAIIKKGRRAIKQGKSSALETEKENGPQETGDTEKIFVEITSTACSSSEASTFPTVPQ